MKVLIALLVVLQITFAVQHATVQEEFLRFMRQYNKTYDSAEETARRLSIFLEAKIRIQELNLKAAEKGFNTKFGITKFADLTPAEFKKFLGYSKIHSKVDAAVVPTTDAFVGALPTSLDWRTKGAVTPVKDQQQCGSCWAFSATEGVESAYYLAYKKLYKLSPQQIVSCDTVDGGCNGGDLPTAFAYVKSKGLELDETYPYTSGGGDSGVCKYKSQSVVARIKGWAYATTKANETAMQAAMVTNGPLSICVDASTWQFYQSGVITHDCSNDLDHCVQLVGWSSTSSTPAIPYWIVRNSWGTDWGLSGYLWVERDKDMCGIADEATYVIA
jgi:C1A family cysteine protease